MYVGGDNVNLYAPLEKMQIKNLDTGDVYNVLYNPQSYTCERSASYAKQDALGGEAPVLQFQHGSGETLSFELFFDCFSAGDEVGNQKDAEKFARNSRMSFTEKNLDVRTYTQDIYDLTLINTDEHRPPRVEVMWASLQFTGFLVSCTQNFTKFNHDGRPVRAVLNCQFSQYWDAEREAQKSLNSPDTTKVRTVRQGDSLWALAAREYGGPGDGRQIAEANGISTPRLLYAGETLVLPAVD